MILIVKKLVGFFIKKEFAKTQAEFRIDKLVKRKGNKLYQMGRLW